MGGHNLAVGMGSDFDLRDLLKPHLSPALPHALEKDKSIGRSTWSPYNNNKYADLSRLTYHQHYPHWRTRVLAGQNNSKNADLSSLNYHQHYPALETDKSIDRSNVNAWPWKPHLSPQRLVSQHRIRQDYWQVHWMAFIHILYNIRWL